MSGQLTRPCRRRAAARRDRRGEYSGLQPATEGQLVMRPFAFRRVTPVLLLAVSLTACGEAVAPTILAAPAASVGQLPCQHPFIRAHWWADSEVADLRAQYPERCALHDTATISGTVEMFCGTVLFGWLGELKVNISEYGEAQQSLFPNSNSWAGYDYNGAYWAATVRYCASCREAECQWLEQHRGA